LPEGNAEQESPHGYGKGQVEHPDQEVGMSFSQDQLRFAHGVEMSCSMVPRSIPGHRSRSENGGQDRHNDGDEAGNDEILDSRSGLNADADLGTIGGENFFPLQLVILWRRSS